MKFRQSLFWDVNLKSDNIKRNAAFVIERILEYGDENDVRWMFRNFKASQIKQVLSEGKNISPKSANYWALILKLPKSKILCLKKSYQKMRRSHWPY